MRRRDLVLRIVLNEISDDYENLHQITIQVTALSSRCGLTIEPQEILKTLGILIDNGLAKAYRLFTTKTPAFRGMPPLDEIGSPYETTVDDVYFWVTKRGMRLQMSDYRDWPFDDHDVLKPEWKPPES